MHAVVKWRCCNAVGVGMSSVSCRLHCQLVTCHMLSGLRCILENCWSIWRLVFCHIIYCLCSLSGSAALTGQTLYATEVNITYLDVIY